jgi:ankyrin repeat protein
LKNSKVEAAERGQVEILTKQWDWAKVLQVKPEGLRNEVVVSTDKYGKTTWHKAAECGQVENLVELWYFANELQLET